MKYLYKYPQAAVPIWGSGGDERTPVAEEMEYELLDTGVFDDDRYFDVFLEYAKEGPEDILIRITAYNRGPEAGRLQLLPTLWFRNTWSWKAGSPKPSAASEKAGSDTAPRTRNWETTRSLRRDARAALHREREQRRSTLWDQPNAPLGQGRLPPVCGLGNSEAVNPAKTGTKAAARYHPRCSGRRSWSVRLRLSAAAQAEPVGEGFDEIVAARLAEADEFYDPITPPRSSEDEKRVHRQALAGMLWGKQYYYSMWTRGSKEHDAHPLVGGATHVRNAEWFHMFNGDIISMPDKWEYPWYAAWDLAFHTLALSLVDFDFAKEQLLLMLRSLYLHPNGQIPAYEWNFSDVNPPVHAWATLLLFKFEQTSDARTSNS